MRINRSSAKNFVILTFFSLLTVLFVLNEAVGASITATEEWAATSDGESSNIEFANSSGVSTDYDVSAVCAEEVTFVCISGYFLTSTDWTCRL